MVNSLREAKRLLSVNAMKLQFFFFFFFFFWQNLLLLTYLYFDRIVYSSGLKMLFNNRRICICFVICQQKLHNLLQERNFAIPVK